MKGETIVEILKSEFGDKFTPELETFVMRHLKGVEIDVGFGLIHFLQALKDSCEKPEQLGLDAQPADVVELENKVKAYSTRLANMRKALMLACEVIAREQSSKSVDTGGLPGEDEFEAKTAKDFAEEFIAEAYDTEEL